jgi:isoleucyl-tRNA synthetase
MVAFEPVPSRVSFPAQEEGILQFWKEKDVFRRSVEQRPIDRVFSFYEGPPTANGNPGIHHVLARVFKDLIPRYQTMRGYRVPRKGGWDTHGLPVELEVEKALGFSSKPEIEAYGIEAFNERCRESVFRYVQEWERMTDRIGFWIDTEDAYVTYHPNYIESAWWIFKRLWDNDLMYRGFRVTPHCPRCQTSLSSHEIAQGYEEDTPDPSVYVRFPVTGGVYTKGGAVDQWLTAAVDSGQRVSLLIWTTTPWTLAGNTAIAVSPKAQYAAVELKVEGGTEIVIVARDRARALFGDDAIIVGTALGSDLLGLDYDAPYPAETWDGVEVLQFSLTFPEAPRSNESLVRQVVPGEFVGTDDGTGLVHIAPAFGEDDYRLGGDAGLMFLQPVRLDGTLIGGPGDGLFAKVADAPIIEDLRARGLLWKHETIRHTYPFCWRCGTAVLYYAKPSWYIRTTAVRDALVENNEQIHWVPGHIQEGRFGEWLEGNIDWAVSRERYWGTPLPIWTCDLCDTQEVMGSYAELFDRALPGTATPMQTQGLAAQFGVDPHRPYVDQVELGCRNCGGSMKRTPEVADAWFDSGAMPYAQWHYPFENEATFDNRFPADFICEAVDQTRGWFYTLHALATLLNRTEDVPEGISFKNVICLGHILDGEGQKMSKSKGNVVDPWTVLDASGADAIRWYMYTASPPGNSRRFSADLVAEVQRRFISTLWNTYSFFVTYANTADFDPTEASSAPRSELDRWVLSELNRTIREVTQALDAYEPADAARPIEAFVEQLSNWYVRRSRRRFWRSGDDVDSQAALHTLYTCLVTVAKLLAPFTPFLAESLYQNLVASRVPGASDSVHLEDWPAVDESAIDEQLSADVALVQRMVSLGRAARSKANAKVRQPLATAVLVPRNAAEVPGLQRLADQVAEELNVKSVEVLDDPGDRMTYTLRPNLPVLGPKYGNQVGAVRNALGQADPAEVVRAMRAGEPVVLPSADGGEFTLAGSDILVTVESGEGWSAAEESGYAALVDTRIDDALHLEGVAREIVRRIQDLRREAALDVSDRIFVAWKGDPIVGQALAVHGAYIAGEVLAREIVEGDVTPGATVFDGDLDGIAVMLAVQRV